MKPFLFIKPINADQALAKKNETSQFIGGGTNLLDLMKKEISQPETLLDITDALSNTLQATENAVSIGATVRNSTVAINADIVSKFPLVGKAILAGASPQIRNMATTAGNLLQRTRCPYFYDISTACNKRKPGSGCTALHGNNRMSAIVGWSEQCVAVHPSDFCVALAALDATVSISDKNKKMITIPFKEFHRLPENNPERDNTLPANAMIRSVEIPANAFHKNCAYVKLRDRDSYAFALVSVAAALQLDGNKIIDARLASGGVAHKPWRWYSVEQYLKGKQASERTFSEAADMAVKETKPLAGNGFKLSLLRGAMHEALQNCLTV